MANFNTHLFVACAASGIAAVNIYTKQWISLVDIPWFIFLGTVGGLLPDIDSNTSRPLRLLFWALSILASLLTILIYKDQYQMQTLVLLSIAAFLIIRYPVMYCFQRMTVHRGVFHSVLTAGFFVLLTVFISHDLFHNSIAYAWISGLFIGFGFIVHLLLDEFYSVELSNVQLKGSFGSAFKLFSFKYLRASFAMLLACAVLYAYTPALPFQPPKVLIPARTALQTGSTYIEKHLAGFEWCLKCRFL